MSTPVIVWFRQDLRLRDNPAFDAAVASGCPIIPLFILDRRGPGAPGAAGGWWLDKSLTRLADEIVALGGRLIVREGPEDIQLRDVLQATGADRVFLNRRFEPAAFDQDADIAHGLKLDGVDCQGFNGALLVRPGAVLNGQGQPYRVFTPFMKALRPHLTALASPAPHGSGAVWFQRSELETTPIDVLGLHPVSPDWSTGFDWSPGEAAALDSLDHFIKAHLADYPVGRDRPGRPGTSRLSPYLHWGEISPRRVVSRVLDAVSGGAAPAGPAEKFIAEIGWREFSAHLLVHFPTLTTDAFRPEYDAMPWRDDAAGFAAWRRGLTGFPIVDAGMRELWRTGWMHNRVRMIVASFLVKDLLIDWRKGAAWFEETLVDADLASNAQNWQWVAGSGADAAPYFRIFNPVSQGETHDPQGAYVRRWVPELSGLPDKWIHSPWAAPPEVLARAGVRLGRDYPAPILDHSAARSRALDALKTVAARREAD
ncbi:cryptochrome/photolyase family protein [Brevundimonas sp. FT23028]|uniref:cryptochrome/photolyase family protein n=1 Tax=Brevundimonas sp. FT23028 TaxID=3393748 RepID=UPI003B5884DD